jgi:hypothetical protein
MKSLLILSLFLLVSCATRPPDLNVALAGEWLYENPAQSCRYDFKKDGTFSGEVKQNGETLSRFTGRWGVREGELLYEYTSDALGKIPPGTLDRDKLLKTGAREFVIQASDGSQRTYRRIR